jgi:hypothetical protein
MNKFDIGMYNIIWKEHKGKIKEVLFKFSIGTCRTWQDGGVKQLLKREG